MLLHCIKMLKFFFIIWGRIKMCVCVCVCGGGGGGGGVI